MIAGMRPESDIEAGDAAFMERALVLAARAADAGEVPVGAVLVLEGEVIGEGANAQIASSDPTAHAEIVALREAAKTVGNYRLPGATLFVTLEPCSMCCGALVHARVKRLVFAATEPRAGAVMSTRALLDEDHFNHRVTWDRATAFAAASGDLLRDFFRARR